MSKQKPWKVTTNTMLAVLAFRYDLIHTYCTSFLFILFCIFNKHCTQDAEKGILFASFPPVLHLHLMRFQYDPITDSSVKFNDKCEFPEILDLSSYIHNKDEEEVNPEDHKYVLHAVLVHR